MKLLTVQNYIDIKVENINIFRMIFFVENFLPKTVVKKGSPVKKLEIKSKAFLGVVSR